MQELKLEKCIKELNKSNKNRNQEIIIDYLKTLVPFMNLVNEKNEYSTEIINKISKIMTYQKNIKNDLIIQYGDKGNDFYIILKGNINILVPKYSLYYMDEEEFILHLLKLRKYNQNELIIQCLRCNALNFAIPTERLDDLILDLQKKKSNYYLYKKTIINKAKEVYEYINKKENSNKNIKNISPEDYIALFEVDESIKKNTSKLIHLSNLKIEFDKKDEDKKLTKIPNYEIVAKFGIGDTFGELALEHMNKKRMATIITSSDCDFAVIDKIEYNELIKDSINKSKDKFYNLIYKYKIFDSISTISFDKKYYNYFRYLKMKKNEILFNEGDPCDDVYFILNGEYELYVDKNIFEINQMILKLKIIVDELKKIIIHETKNFEKINLKNKSKSLTNIKNNLNLFFNKFENEINLEEVTYIIKNKDIINRLKFLGSNFYKKISNKKRIRLGIYKSRQIIGLSDTINRYFGDNKCFFNCKCFSFSGELYYIKYNKFLSIYEQEENVKLYTSELLYQNLYYIIGRLLSHKKFIYEKANKKENDFIDLIHLGENKKDINHNYDKLKINKNAIYAMINKIKNSSLIKEKNKNNINYKLDIKANPFKSISSEKNSDTNYGINDLYPLKNNFNIFKNINQIKMDNNSLSDTKRNESNNNDFYNNFNISSRSNNNISGVESFIFSNGKNGIRNINNIQSQKILKKDNKFNSKNILGDSNKKFKNTEVEKKIEYPVLVINDKEVKINENSINKKRNIKKNYKNILKPIDSKNKKLIELINSKEVKNMVIYSDQNDNIEIHQKLKHLRKKKGLLLSRNFNKFNIKTLSKEDNKIIHNYLDKKEFYSTISYKSNSPKFLTYNLSDVNGNNLKQIKLKINGTSRSPTYNNKINILKIKKGSIKKRNKFRQSLTCRNFYSYD